MRLQTEPPAASSQGNLGSNHLFYQKQHYLCDVQLLQGDSQRKRTEDKRQLAKRLSWQMALASLLLEGEERGGSWYLYPNQQTSLVAPE